MEKSFLNVRWWISVHLDLVTSANLASSWVPVSCERGGPQLPRSRRQSVLYYLVCLFLPIQRTVVETYTHLYYFCLKVSSTLVSQNLESWLHSDLPFFPLFLLCGFLRTSPVFLIWFNIDTTLWPLFTSLQYTEYKYKKDYKEHLKAEKIMVFLVCQTAILITLCTVQCRIVVLFFWNYTLT